MMQSLSVLIRKSRTLLTMKWCDKKLLLEALFLTALSRMVVIFIPFKKYSKYIGVYNTESSYDIDANQYKTIKRVAWAVCIISNYTLWESKCLVQAMTAQRMLKSRKICSTLYLGVNKDGINSLKAHAWLRCGQLYVTGGYYKNDFQEVAKFANEIIIKEASIV